MNAFGKPYDAPYPDWDQERVGLKFYLSLHNHPVFKRDKQAVTAAHLWLDEIAAAQHANDGEPVAFGYKTIQDRFRKFSQSHVAFVRALCQRGLVVISKGEGKGRSFALTANGWQLLQDGNYRWLHLLITNPKTRRRNQVAIARRKPRRTAYADPLRQGIDDFRYGVEFERAGLLKQLRVDNSRLGESADRRRNFVIHPLLAFVRRKFCDLENNGGVIYHEWMPLPWHYRRFASFNGKQYIAALECRGDWLRRFFQVLCEYGRSLGLALVYDYESVSVFGDGNAPELPKKLEQVKSFIQRQQEEGDDRMKNPGDCRG